MLYPDVVLPSSMAIPLVRPKFVRMARGNTSTDTTRLKHCTSTTLCSKDREQSSALLPPPSVGEGAQKIVTAYHPMFVDLPVVATTNVGWSTCMTAQRVEHKIHPMNRNGCTRAYLCRFHVLVQLLVHGSILPPARAVPCDAH
jgi:hypothetical protein